MDINRVVEESSICSEERLTVLSSVVVMVNESQSDVDVVVSIIAMVCFWYTFFGGGFGGFFITQIFKQFKLLLIGFKVLNCYEE